MNFDELDKKMRVYEKSLDQRILPEIYMVARLDGRSFSRLTKEICKFEAPFDVKFRDMMVKTVEYLMDCGFRVLYAYTESDEISLLFYPGDETFGRKVRKYNSTLAAEASAVFSLALGMPATFDCRIVPLPNIEKVKEYFRWRQEDARRNSLNSYCYWTLRKAGKTVREATSLLAGKSVAYKNELLFQNGINFDSLPNWQKRGVGLWKEQYQTEGFNPIKNCMEPAERSRIKIEYDLPIGEKYTELIQAMIE